MDFLLQIVEQFVRLPFLLQMLFLYILAINLITFFYFGFDKIRSRFKERRVSEKRLWTLSLIGGTIGAFFGMKYFRHKTKKVSFQIGMALILVCHILLIYMFYSYMY